MTSRTLRLGNPSAGLAVLTIAVAAGMVSGQLWLLIAGLGLLAVIGIAWSNPATTQKTALASLLIGHVLMAAAWAKPEDNNYLAYSIAFAALVSAGAALARGIPRIEPPLAFLAWLLVSATFTTARLEPEPAYVLFVAPIGLLAVYLVVRLSDEGTRYFLALSLVSFAAAQALMGLGQTLFDVPTFAALGSRIYYEPRNYLAVFISGLSPYVRMATGTFDHFNGLGSLLSLVTPIVFGAWYHRRTTVLSLLLLLLTAGLVVTFSRGALIGALVGTMLIYLSSARGTLSRGSRYSLVALTGGLGIVAVFGAMSEYAAATGNLASRLGAWMLALENTVRDPLTLVVGAGYGFYGEGYLASHGAVSRLHSAPVQVFSELGLIGLCLVIVGVVFPIARGLKSTSPRQYVIAAGAAAFLIHQFVDNALFGLPGMFLIAAIAALMIEQRDSRDLEMTCSEEGLRGRARLFG